VTVSIGVAVFEPDHPDPSPEELVRRADHALYRAKEEGRNRVAMSAPLAPTAPDLDAVMGPRRRPSLPNVVDAAAAERMRP
jgi:predicted signal transduction protein with EAL and GGDEF domain